MRVKVSLKEGFNEVTTEKVQLNRKENEVSCDADLNESEIKALNDTEAVDVVKVEFKSSKKKSFSKND